jgi:AcrR family transcriptional regulator
MLQRGLQQATVAEIAAAAALGKGTVYLQFDSKDDVVDALRQRYVEGIEQAARAAVRRATSPPDQLRAFVRSFVIASTSDPELHHLLFHEAGVDEAKAFAPLRVAFIEVVKGGGFPATNIDLVIDFTLGGIHAAAITVAHLPANRRARAVSAIADLVSRALGAER